MGVIENQTFRLRDGVDEAAFLAADKRAQEEFFPNLPGFARRTTARGDGGEWLVAILWASTADAEAAAAMANDAKTAFDACVDAATLHVRRYTMLD